MTPTFTELVLDVAREVVGDDATRPCPPIMGAEDFSRAAAGPWGDRLRGRAAGRPGPGHGSDEPFEPRRFRRGGDGRRDRDVRRRGTAPSGGLTRRGVISSSGSR